jgi:hypothetical protein
MGMATCQVDGCTQTVSKTGHIFCRDHWKAERDGKLKRCDKCNRWLDYARSSHVCNPPVARKEKREESPKKSVYLGKYLSATRIGEHFGLSNIKINLILAELGWIEKYVKGWVPTDRGNALGANVREMDNGTPFVVWPESLLNNPVLCQSVNENFAHQVQTSSAKRISADKQADPRAKYPATLRAQDGHYVRSRAEVLIDNWLYMQGIVHAYERRLPIEEECYCDFYLPRGKGVYIEYWGQDADPKYSKRKADKLAIYAKYKLRIIELINSDIERLDDVLPRKLLKFGIESV